MKVAAEDAGEKNCFESYLVNHSGVKSFKSPTGGSVREFSLKCLLVLVMHQNVPV